MGDGRRMRVRMAVHVHVFYPELIQELSVCVRNLVSAGAEVSTFVTYPDCRDGLADTLPRFFPDAKIIRVPNAGYDVGPFFEVLNRIDLSNCDYVVKLHTKRDKPVDWVNFHCFRGSGWRRALLSFCATPAAARRSMAAFTANPKLGMIADRRVIDPSGIGQGDYPEWKRLRVLRGLGICPRSCTFVYGTMFMVRAELLKAIWGRVRMEDFSAIANPHVDYGLALEWELAFPVLVESQGCYVSDGCLPGWCVTPYFRIVGLKLMILRKTVDAVRKCVGSKRLNGLFRCLGIR